MYAVFLRGVTLSTVPVSFGSIMKILL